MTGAEVKKRAKNEVFRSAMTIVEEVMAKNTTSDPLPCSLPNPYNLSRADNRNRQGLESFPADIDLMQCRSQNLTQPTLNQEQIKFSPPVTTPSQASNTQATQTVPSLTPRTPGHEPSSREEGPDTPEGTQPIE
ncbi:hypothetical protein Pmani_025827 [Petrolisthes manimaculis]|uniref:Uncharacterized protein n=1 Tax=Petrolisthes manimaculis TaxID=1843537 RepID=A0AAE1P5B9_9EUCA|nr:hypothetical protein Pmani_025827 [Petrolisthes manimaculis]